MLEISQSYVPEVVQREDFHPAVFPGGGGGVLRAFASEPELAAGGECTGHGRGLEAVPGTWLSVSADSQRATWVDLAAFPGGGVCDDQWQGFSVNRLSTSLESINGIEVGERLRTQGAGP